MLEIQKFIKENENFRSLLSEKPFSIKIIEDENFILFKYSQIDSDFKSEIVRECRGIILDNNDYTIACRPFSKFGNYGEEYVPEIDWESAETQEKLDGSLIKCWYNRYDNKWQWSTNGTIRAESAELQQLVNFVPGINNFQDLIDYTLDKMNLSDVTKNFDYSFTYLFELCTPMNKVVVTHDDFTLYHLATKHNITGDEDYDYIGFPQPKRYSLSSYDECVESASKLPFSEEGYVVVDKNLNRVKIKSPAYLAVHHLKGEGQLVKRRVLDLIRLNEHEEFLIYFEEYRKYFEDLNEKYIIFMDKLQESILEAQVKTVETNSRKEFAEWATKQIVPSVMFKVYDGRVLSNIDAIKDIKSEKLLGYLK